METDTGKAYYKLNQAVNNFCWIRTHPIVGEQTRRERIAKCVKDLKAATDAFLFAYREEYENAKIKTKTQTA